MSATASRTPDTTTTNRPPKTGRTEAGTGRPHRLRALWHTTIGKKYVAAVTGFILALWVIAHMLGNLKALEGPGGGHAAIDAYGRFLRHVGSPVLPNDMGLWMVRGILLAAIGLHIAAVTQLWRRNRAAKAAAHQAKRNRSTVSARLMKASGVLVLAFIIFHILHFTTRTIHPAKLTDGAIYANAYGSFHKWWVVVIYVAAVALIGLHFNHGLWSGAQTTGADNPDRNWLIRRTASALALLTFAGFALVPVLFAFNALPRPVHP